MEDANSSGANQPALNASAQPFNPAAPAFQPNIRSPQYSHPTLSQIFVSTSDLHPPQMPLLGDDFSDMRGRFSAFTAPFVQVKASQSRSLTGVSGLSLLESARPTPPQYIAPTPSFKETRVAHSTQSHVQPLSSAATVGQNHENSGTSAPAPLGTRNSIAEQGALALWNRAERETAERDPEGWIALARQEFDRLQEVYKPGSIPSDVLQAHLTKYAAAYPSRSESQEKGSTSATATATMAPTEATPPKPIERWTSEMTSLPDRPRQQSLQKLVPGIDSRGRVVMTTSADVRAESSDQAAPGKLTTPTHDRYKALAGPSGMGPTSDEFSPGPAFPALGTHPGRKAPDKPGETIKIPYPGGPVSHNPRKTMPRPPQGPAAMMKTATTLEAFVIPGGRLKGPKRPKRSDQGPLPSEADIYPDDSMTSDVGSSEAGAGSGTSRHRRNTSASMAFSSPHDRRASISSATRSGFTPEQAARATRALTAAGTPGEIRPPGSGRFAQPYVEDEADAPSHTRTADMSESASFDPPAMTGQGNPSMNLMAAFSQLAQHSAQQAQFFSQLSAIQEENALSPSRPVFPAAPASMNLRGEATVPAASAIAIPDGISDIQKISPLSTAFDEISTPQVRQAPAAAPRFPVGNTYYRGLGQKQAVLGPKPRSLEPDQIDGSRYGIELGGLGLYNANFVWNPPRPDRTTPLGRMGYLWGQP